MSKGLCVSCLIIN